MIPLNLQREACFGNINIRKCSKYYLVLIVYYTTSYKSQIKKKYVYLDDTPII